MLAAAIFVISLSVLTLVLVNFGILLSPVSAGGMPYTPACIQQLHTIGPHSQLCPQELHAAGP